ncbi:MAG: cyclase family protein [Chloroflexi bacterium]|nr:cyclase family protein [Chloroflexota bacterium]
MRVHDLSMPIWEGAGYGEILPITNSSVRFIEYLYYERHGLRETMYKVDGESGSPLMVAMQLAPFNREPIQPNPKHLLTVDQIPIEDLVLRETVVVDVPAQPGHEITEDEMTAALERSDFRRGDEVLLRTGWGSRERAFTMGLDYFKNTPCLKHAAGLALARVMEAMDSHIFMTDCALVNPPRVQGNNWFTGDKPYVPLPKPWPSAEARERMLRLRTQVHDSVHDTREPSSYGAIIRTALAGCKCLVDCHQISGRRCRTIILPLKIRDGGASPCRFFALED